MLVWDTQEIQALIVQPESIFCFVDSDDYIATDMVEKTYKCAEQYNADIVMYGYKRSRL